MNADVKKKFCGFLAVLRRCPRIRPEPLTSRFGDSRRPPPSVSGSLSRPMNRFAESLVIAGLSLAAAGSLRAQDKSFTVTLVPPVHGKVQLTPPLPADGKYTAGTVVTVTTTPDSGYVLDSAWYSVAGRFGQMYHEGMTRDFKVTIDQDKRIGASFIEAVCRQGPRRHQRHRLREARREAAEVRRVRAERRRATSRSSSSSTAADGRRTTKTSCAVSPGS